MRTAKTHCTWFPWCAETAAHEVERHTSDEVVVHEVVCDRHLPNALARGYEERAVPTDRRPRRA
jgi:hypothetical protein